MGAVIQRRMFFEGSYSVEFLLDAYYFAASLITPFISSSYNLMLLFFSFSFFLCVKPLASETKLLSPAQ